MCVCEWARAFVVAREGIRGVCNVRMTPLAFEKYSKICQNLDTYVYIYIYIVTVAVLPVTRTRGKRKSLFFYERFKI